MNQIFTVTGMTCGHCEKTVRQAVLALDPQAEIKIDRSQNRVEVNSKVPAQAIVQAISEEGYPTSAH